MSILDELDYALGQAILCGLPIEKAEEARDSLFEIDNTVAAAIDVIDEARLDPSQNCDELLSEAVDLLKQITTRAV